MEGEAARPQLPAWNPEEALAIMDSWKCLTSQHFLQCLEYFVTENFLL